MNNLYRISLVFILCFSGFAAAAQSVDFPKEAFTQEKFEAYAEQGVPVLIDVYASWCPTCERQQWLLNTYFEENPTSKLKVLIVDYDKDTKWVKHFKAPRQSTLLLFQHGKRLWFSVAETRKRIVFDEIKKIDL